MGKYKVCVYAICKNESKHIDRWYKSMSEADEIYVLDTGSTDNSIELLQNHGVVVKKKIITPWRFDKARNISLDMVPDDADICVCTDLDEIFDAGWRNKLESIWNDKVSRVKYKLIFSFDEYNNPATTLFISKIHKREGFKWVHAIHEVLESNDGGLEITSNDIILKHYPDITKSRSNYLELLKISVVEEPESDRNIHYLGREYMYNGDYVNAIITFHKHLNHKNSLWNEERCASMRYMGRCYKELELHEESVMWYKNAIKECSTQKESYVELGLLYYLMGKYEESLRIIERGNKIKSKNTTYINEDFAWNSLPYDLLSICAYNLNKRDLALKYIKKAIELDPANERLFNNLDIINNTN